jgi:IS1 family transposase
MANILKREKQVYAISALAEGASIRSIERITGIHRDTVMRLGVRVGQGCKRILDTTMRNLRCDYIQLDEIWGFIAKKRRNAQAGEENAGDVWTFVAIDPKSKAVPCFEVGQRDSETANQFVLDLSSRLANRVQISSDSMSAYIEAIELGFGSNVDYGQIVKTYLSEKPLPASSRYSPPPILSVKQWSIVGYPEKGNISTSIIERQNLTMRMHCRRLTRLTNAFSKKLDNFKAAIALHFAYYNLVKIHRTIRMTPAMAIKATDRLWSISELVDRALEQSE